MTVQTVNFAYSINDKVVVTATTRPGWVSGLSVKSDGVSEYYVATNDADGKGTSAWMAVGDLGDWVDPVVTTITSLAYFQLFTVTEQLAIFGSDIPQVRLAVAFSQAAGTIDLTDPQEIGGIDQLVGFGLITAERAVRIKAGLAPLPA